MICLSTAGQPSLDDVSDDSLFSGLFSFFFPISVNYMSVPETASRITSEKFGKKYARTVG